MITRGVMAAALLGVPLALVPGRAHAQDSLEQWLEGDAPVVFDAPGSELVAIDALLAAERWHEAAVRLLPLVDSDLEPRADARLATALAELGHTTAAYRLATRIAERAGHPGRAAALTLLARLPLPEAADLADVLAHYDLEDLAPFAGQPRLYGRLAYLAGRGRYRLGDYDAARALLEAVPAGTPRFPRAQLFLGMIHTRARTSVPAARAFQLGLEHARDPELRALLQLSLARLFYTAAFPGGVDGPIDELRISAAVKWWREIPEESPLWVQAHFESAWAYFMAGDYSQALGHVHSVTSPFFEHLSFPEAEVIRGIVSFVNCRYDDTLIVAARSEARNAPLRRQLAALIERLDDDSAVERLLRRGLRASEPLGMRNIVDAVRRDPAVRRYLRYQRALAREARRMVAPELADRVAGEISDARRELRRRIGALGRRQLRAALADLRVWEREMRKLAIDATNAQRALLEEPAGAEWSELPLYELSVMPDPEHVIWPFDGEYWRDEIGSYRAVVTGQCH